MDVGQKGHLSLPSSVLWLFVALGKHDVHLTWFCQGKRCGTHLSSPQGSDSRGPTLDGDGFSHHPLSL